MGFLAKTEHGNIATEGIIQAGGVDPSEAGEEADILQLAALGQFRRQIVPIDEGECQIATPSEAGIKPAYPAGGYLAGDDRQAASENENGREAGTPNQAREALAEFDHPCAEQREDEEPTRQRPMGQDRGPAGGAREYDQR